ncbi:MAG: shikimate kinase [Flavobacteriales bacterium]|nr:shikimate kinase [Flavobacteriales bacterium]
MRIFLVGYMASGKTTVAPLLAARLALPWKDLDEEIARVKGISVEEIFRIHGEAYFRKLEMDMLTRLIEKHQHMVLATGGGTAGQSGAMELMNKSGITVYLDVHPEGVVERLAREPVVRPLIAGIQSDHLLVFVTKHMHSRLPFYHLAHLHIDGTEPLENQLDEIERQLDTIARK